jgi:hypothetical protein
VNRSVEATFHFQIFSMSNSTYSFSIYLTVEVTHYITSNDKMVTAIYFSINKYALIEHFIQILMSYNKTWIYINKLFDIYE